MLAGLSPDHYSRLEQGRQHTVTDDVVDALSRALQLDDVERAHLRDLAAPLVPATAAARPDRPARADPGMLRLMATLDHVPALLLGRRSEVLARNALLREVLGWTAERRGRRSSGGCSSTPRARVRITNWADFAAAAVGALRYEVGRHPDDRRLAALVGELRARDPDVARWWDDQRVTFRTSLTKHIAHPMAGPAQLRHRVRRRAARPRPAPGRLHRRTRLPHRPRAAAAGRLGGGPGRRRRATEVASDVTPGAAQTPRHSPGDHRCSAWARAAGSSSVTSRSNSRSASTAGQSAGSSSVGSPGSRKGSLRQWSTSERYVANSAPGATAPAEGPKASRKSW